MSAEVSMTKKAESTWRKEERYQNLPCLTMLVGCASLVITLEFPHNHSITADYFFILVLVIAILGNFKLSAAFCHPIL